MQQYLDVALKAARNAATYILEESKKVRQVDFKGATDLVTQADRGSEQIILKLIRENFPDHNILTEESEGQVTESPIHWIIDPLDGTTNFVHGYPFYAISIAVHQEGIPVVGVIADVYHHHFYSAVTGKGAFRNGKPIYVSSTTDLNKSLLATGFPYLHDEKWAKNFEHMQKFTDITQGVRRAGAAAIDLAHVACGWIDGFWEVGLHPWDTAAGILLVEEAGGKVSKMYGDKFSIYNKEIVASNGHIHKDMIKILT